MGHVLDEAYFVLKAVLDESMKRAPVEVQATARQLGATFEKEGKRVERAIGEGFRKAVIDIAVTIPQARAAAEQAGAAMGTGVEHGLGSRTPRVRDAAGRVVREAASGAAPVARHAGEDLGRQLGAGVESGVGAAKSRIEASAEEVIADVERRFQLRMAKLRIGASSGRYTDERYELLQARATALHDTSLLRSLAERQGAGVLSDDDIIRFAEAMRVRGTALGSELGEGVVEGAHSALSEAAGRLVEQAIAMFSIEEVIRRTVELLQKDWEAADRLEASNRKLAATARITGINLDFLKSVAHEANEELHLGAIQSNEMTGSIVKLASQAGQLDKTGEALRSLLDVAASAGYTSREALEAINAALRGEDTGTDKLFGGKNPSVIWKEYGDQIGVAVAKMTDQQKAQALLNELLETGAKVRGEYARALDTQAGKDEQARIAQEELSAETGKNTEGMRNWVRVLRGEFSSSINEAIAGVGRLGNWLGWLLNKFKEQHPEIAKFINLLRQIQLPSWLGGGADFWQRASAAGERYRPTSFYIPVVTDLANFYRGTRAFNDVFNPQAPPQHVEAPAPRQPTAAEQLEAGIAQAQKNLEALRDRGELARATARATRSEREYQQVVAQTNRELNQAAVAAIDFLKRRGATAEQLADFAKFVRDPTPGPQGSKSTSAADNAENQLEVQAQQLQLLQKYWSDAATAPTELRSQVEGVLRLERELNQVEGERARIRAAHRDTGAADAVYADLERQLQIARAQLEVLGPLQAEYARRQAEIESLRGSMTDEQFEQAGRDAAAKFDGGLAAGIAAHPEIGDALSRFYRGSREPQQIAASLTSDLRAALERENTAAAVRQLLGGSPEETRNAGEAAALDFVEGLQGRIREAANDPARLEQLAKLLPSGIDLRAVGLQDLNIDMGGESRSVVSALGDVDAAVRSVADAQTALDLVTRQYGESSPQWVAANETLAQSHQAVREIVEALEQALASANLTDQQTAFVTEKLAQALGKGGVKAKDFADSLDSLTGKLTLVQGLADAFGDLADNVLRMGDAVGIGEELRAEVEAIADTVRAVGDLAGSLKQLQKARATQATNRANGVSGVADTLGVLGGYLGVAGSVLGVAASLGNAIFGAAERHRLAQIRQTVELIRNTEELRRFREKGQIGDVTPTEREKIIAAGQAFVSKHTLYPDSGDVKISASEVEFIKRLEEITGTTLLDDKGRVNAANFFKAWQAFQDATLGSFGNDVEGRLRTFQFLMQQLGESMDTPAEKIKELIAQLSKAGELSNTAFLSQLQQVFDEQGAEAAAAWLRHLSEAFAAGGPAAAEIAALFGTNVTADEIQRILQEALGTVTGGGSGTVGGGDNAQRLNVSATEVQFNAALIQWATQTEYLRKIAETVSDWYQLATGAPLVVPKLIPAPSVAEVQAITQGTAGGVTIEVTFEGDFNFGTLQPGGPSDLGGAMRVAGEAVARPIGERVATALRGKGLTGPVRIKVLGGGLPS